MEIDVGSIVPSTRDVFQVIGTRKRSLALIALIGSERTAEGAARLHDLGVSAFAFEEPGRVMQLGAQATKTVPSILLLPVADRDGCLAARFFGADAVCIEGTLPPADWDRLAKNARTTRMLPLAFATSAESLAGAVEAGARAVVVRAGTVEEALALASAAPKTLTLVADVRAGSEAVRALVGRFDAAIVPESVHGDARFAELVTAVDP